MQLVYYLSYLLIKGENMQEKVTLQARFIMNIFRNDTNGYTVSKFRMFDKQDKEFTATGIFKELNDEVVYTLHGEYIEHFKYGMQFKVDSYEIATPSDRDSLIRYFSSSLFPGIGKQTATLLVDAVGEHAVEVIKENPNILDQMHFLNEKKRDSIRQGIKEFESLDDSVVFFTNLGLSMRNIMKLESVYGEEAVQTVKNNPYQMVEDIDGIGFKSADKIAKALSFDSSHPYRIRAIILSSVLEICIATGNSFVTMPQLLHRMGKEYHVSIDIEDYLSELIRDRLLIREDENIYHHTQYDAEKGIAQFLSQFPFIEYDHDITFDLDDEIKALQEEHHIIYEEKQREAFHEFFKHPFMILTGGPGTGKTTIVKGIISLYRKFYLEHNIVCCAPTGRAAKRLSELSEGNATTIHSLLKWDLESNTFLVNEKDPIRADLLIIDEFSMVDQWLFYHLLRACKNVSKILIIGDEDQLPSVGPGAVLKDLIATQLFPIVQLHKIFRQSEGSDVVTLAHEIKSECCESFQYKKDVAFFECRNFEVKNHLISIIQSAYEKGYHNKDIQVLAPMYGGVAGIDTLNNTLQKVMNPADSYKRELKVGYRTYREEDKVLQLKNQPDDDVYNGDIGVILEIVYAGENIHKQNQIIVDYDGNIVTYSGEQIQNITHAYCISIHKAQGSEYPIVIMPVVSDYYYMLQKRLIYTGVTRARKSIILLGQQSVFQKAIQTKEKFSRETTLQTRLINFFA